MLRKLIKYEFIATGRIMLPMYLVLLLSAVGANLSARGMLDNQSSVLETLGALLAMAFGIAVTGVFILVFMMMIQRFYKNLLQDEGYLMLTLPVSIHQHIWAKLFVSAVWFIATVLAVTLASMVVAYDIRVLREVPSIFIMFFRGLRLLTPSEILNGTAYLIEMCVLCFLMLMAFCLQFYAALAVGHSFSSHKMAASIACFFAFMFAVMFIIPTLFMAMDALQIPLPRLNLDPPAAIHLGLLIMNGFVLIYGAVFYAITTFFLKRRLNLE